MLANGDLVVLHAENETCHKFAIHFIVFPRSRILETVRCVILAHEHTQHANKSAAFSPCVRAHTNKHLSTSCEGTHDGFHMTVYIDIFTRISIMC
jgi:hypothetical protein